MQSFNHLYEASYSWENSDPKISYCAVFAISEDGLNGFMFNFFEETAYLLTSFVSLLFNVNIFFLTLK